MHRDGTEEVIFPTILHTSVWQSLNKWIHMGTVLQLRKTTSYE
jgi:prolyl-tRNA synthetase